MKGKKKKMKKVTYNDMVKGKPSEICKSYGLTTRQFEQQVRNELRGATKKESAEFYKTVYDNKRG